MTKTNDQNERKINKLQVESRHKFKVALTPRRYKNKRKQALIQKVKTELNADEVNLKILTKVVMRNGEAHLIEALKWAKSQPGKDKVKLFVLRLREQRLARTATRAVVREAKESKRN